MIKKGCASGIEEAAASNANLECALAIGVFALATPILGAILVLRVASILSAILVHEIILIFGAILVLGGILVDVLEEVIASLVEGYHHVM